MAIEDPGHLADCPEGQYDHGGPRGDLLCSDACREARQRRFDGIADDFIRYHTEVERTIEPGITLAHCRRCQQPWPCEARRLWDRIATVLHRHRPTYVNSPVQTGPDAYPICEGDHESHVKWPCTLVRILRGEET